MSKWGLTHKGTEPLTPEEWNLVVDALEELDKRVSKIRVGLAVWSGDGSTIDFVIEHDLGEEPTTVLIGEGSEDAIGDKWWEANETNVIIHFQNPPPEGTDNVKLWYLILKVG
ncbi:MAG: hypothetical protein QW332_06070 [Thermoproteota archaeon]